jgi:hypothetical protein
MPKLSKADQNRKVTITSLRLRKETALTKLREMEAAERAGSLLRADQVKEACESAFLMTRERVLAISANVRDKLVGLTDVVRIGELIDQEARWALTEVSEWKPKTTKRHAATGGK